MDYYEEKDQSSWSDSSISALEDVQREELEYFQTISRIEFPTKTLFDTRKQNALWTSTGSSLLVVPDEIFDLLESFYEFRNNAQVKEFLNRSSFLVSLLVEAKIELKHYFQDAPLYLEVSEDPEYLGDRHLVIYVHTNLEAKQASDRLDFLFDYWWVKNLKRANGHLTINLEFDD